jgi:hypothetical protein
MLKKRSVGSGSAAVNDWTAQVLSVVEELVLSSPANLNN